MFENLEISNLETLVNLAFNFGPFFFAIFVSIIITRWAYKIYNSANTRENPKASSEELLTYKTYFDLAKKASYILISLSILWWFFINTHNLLKKDQYIFKGKITNFEEYQHIYSGELFLKTTTKQIFYDQTEREIEFVLISPKKINSGDEYKIMYKTEGSQNSKYFTVTYHDKSVCEYQFEIDSKGQIQLIEKGSENFASLLLKPFTKTIYAASIFDKLINNKNRNLNIVNLQNDKILVGEKIDIIDSLNSLSKKELKEILISDKYKEPLLATLIDLSNHTDKELAYKTNELIKEINLKDYITDLLNSTNTKENLKKILSRLDENDIKKIKLTKEITAILPDYENIKKINVYPFGTKLGEVYYINSSKISNKSLSNIETKINNLNTEKEIYKVVFKNENSIVIKSEKKEDALFIYKYIRDLGENPYFETLKN